jgi:hypothetical protein
MPWLKSVVWGGSGSEVDLLVEDRCENGEAGHAKDDTEDNFAAKRKSSAPYHRKWNQNESNVGGDIEAHLEDAVVLIRCALEILDRHSPVLLEGTTEDSIVCDLNDNEPKSDIA